MAPRNYEIDVWSGNTFRRRFRLGSSGEPLDLTGSKLVFIAKYASTTIEKATDVPHSGLRIVIDPDAVDGDGNPAPIDETSGIIELHFTKSETTALPEGRPAMRYEIERWTTVVIDGVEELDETSVLYGGVSVTKWVNTDGPA